jgi:hypothetical protein
MNTTRHTTVRRVATTAVLAGAAVLVAAPAFVGAPPEANGAVSATSQIKTQVGNVGASSGLSAQTRAKLEQMEQAMRVPQPAGSTSNPSDPSDPSSVSATVLALIGGTLVAGAAGFIVYRFRHHGPVGAATA